MLDDAERTSVALQGRIVTFVRAFGLHRPEQTPCGVSIPVSEAHALSLLATEGALSQSDLGGHLGLTKSTVSRLVGQLEQRGLVERRIGERDARRRLVALTGRGQDMAADIAELRRSRLARLFERIPERDRASVLDALDTLIEAARDDDR
jgi:DNA-binding MarR family transcriptional regulator